MTHPRPFRFAAQVAAADSAAAWRDTARRVEGMGFSALTMPDHFGAQLAPVPALAAAAAATESLRLGTMVFGGDYRHPAVLAHECATLDLLSDGRLEVGVGAGWMRTDYDEIGLTYDEPRVRVDRLEETLAVVKALWAGGPVTFTGSHHRIDGHELHPLPLQRPGPPLVVGGGGRRVLSLAAREADIVGINPNLSGGTGGADVASDLTEEATLRKVGWVREAAGERYADLELTMLIGFGLVTDDAAGMARGMAGVFGVSEAAALQVPAVLIGTVDAMCEELQRRRELFDVSYLVFESGTWEAMGDVVARLAGT